MPELNLYSYKMTSDTGFAPNPFWGMLTLATCKANMRRSKKVGDWIAGFTSGVLRGDPVGEERLVYLMRVSKKVPIAEYYASSSYRSKIPNESARLHVYAVGDNIYRPRVKNASNSRDFEQLLNPHHWDGAARCGPKTSRDDDISGGHVLVGEIYAYFGRDALAIPSSVRPTIPPGQHPQGWLTHDPRRAHAFVEYVFKKANGIRIIAPPHKWPNSDDSWRESSS